MAWRFRKRFKLFPGFFLNMSKSGISTTVGIKGFSMNLNKKGAFLNTGIPGTGLSNREKLTSSSTNNNSIEQTPMQKYADKELSDDQVKTFENEYQIKSKKLWISYILWLLLGFFGAHKFYLKETGSGLLYLFTAGLFGIGWFIDAFTLPQKVHSANGVIVNNILREMFET